MAGLINAPVERSPALGVNVALPLGPSVMVYVPVHMVSTLLLLMSCKCSDNALLDSPVSGKIALSVVKACGCGRPSPAGTGDHAIELPSFPGDFAIACIPGGVSVSRVPLRVSITGFPRCLSIPCDPGCAPVACHPHHIRGSHEHKPARNILRLKRPCGGKPESRRYILQLIS